MRALLYETRMFTFTAERERISRLICKLHRYLNANLPSYPVKCNGDVKDYIDITVETEIAKSEILGNQKTMCMWFDFANRKSQLFYILGPLDEAAVGLDPMTLEKSANPRAANESAIIEDPKTAKGKPPAKGKEAPKEVPVEVPATAESAKDAKPPKYTKKQITQIKTENLTVHFGCVEADAVVLSQLHQDVCDLCDKMEASEKLSEACNERDRKGY